MQTVRSQLFEGITNEECARMFQCFGAREAGYEAGALISEFDGEQNAVGVLLSRQRGPRPAGMPTATAPSSKRWRRAVCSARCWRSPARAATRFFWSVGGTAACSISTMTRSPSAAKTPCLHHSILVQNLFRLLSTKTLRLSERVEVLSRRSIREKLLCYFEQLARREKSETVTLPFSLSALAEYISADRSAMMRELKKLKEEGVVQTENRRVTILP